MSKENDASATADLIAASAGEFEAEVLQVAGNLLTVRLPLRRADGRISVYMLAVDATRVTPTVREALPDRLPSFCPQRHVNDNATFCMNWQTAEPVIVTTPAEASDWWARLLAFLRKQEIASRTRRWPGAEWAHGEAAARAQQIIETSAARLGAKFEEALANGRLRTERRRSGAAGGRFIRVFDLGTPLYSVWVDERRIATQRQICICGTSLLPVGACADHSKHAVRLALALHSLPLAESAFWDHFKGQSCCGTMDGCPLAESSPNQSKLAA